MTDIRARIENHLPLIVIRKHTGFVEIADDDLRQLYLLAHEAVHGGPQQPPIFEWPDEEEVPQEQPHTEYDEASRHAAMYFAVQVTIARVTAAHGLDGEVPDPIELAGRILNFIKGN